MYSNGVAKQSAKHLAKNYRTCKADQTKERRTSKPSISFQHEMPKDKHLNHVKDRSKLDEKTKARPKSSLGDANVQNVNANLIINEIEKNVEILKKLYKSSVSSLSQIEPPQQKIAKRKDKKISTKKSKDKSSQKTTPKKANYENIFQKQKNNVNKLKNEQKTRNINEPKQYSATNLFEIYKFYKRSIDSSIARTKEQKGGQSLKNSAKNSTQKNKNQTMTATSKHDRNIETPSDSFKASKNNSTMVSKKLANSLEEEEVLMSKLLEGRQKKNSGRMKKKIICSEKPSKISSKVTSRQKKSTSKDLKTKKKTSGKATKSQKDQFEPQHATQKHKIHKIVTIEQHFQKIQFPEIHNSAFDPNLPILEEEPSNAQESRTAFQVDKTGILDITEERNTKDNDERIRTSQQIEFTLQQSLALKGKLTKKSSSSQELDSLQGCEIPRRDSDDSYLENVEIISIQL